MIKVTPTDKLDACYMIIGARSRNVSVMPSHADAEKPMVQEYDDTDPKVVTLLEGLRKKKMVTYTPTTAFKATLATIAQGEDADPKGDIPDSEKIAKVKAKAAQLIADANAKTAEAIKAKEVAESKLADLVAGNKKPEKVSKPNAGK